MLTLTLVSVKLRFQPKVNANEVAVSQILVESNHFWLNDLGTAQHPHAVDQVVMVKLMLILRDKTKLQKAVRRVTPQNVSKLH